MSVVRTNEVIHTFSTVLGSTIKKVEAHYYDCLPAGEYSISVKDIVDTNREIAMSFIKDKLKGNNNTYELTSEELAAILHELEVSVSTDKRHDY